MLKKAIELQPGDLFIVPNMMGLLGARDLTLCFVVSSRSAAVYSLLGSGSQYTSITYINGDTGTITVDALFLFEETFETITSE